MEAARALGFAARFVSGYVYSPRSRRRRRPDGGATHAWARIYLPGAGWVEFDPTNGIVGNRDLVRVAIARDPAQALPLHGTWVGFPADCLGMTSRWTLRRKPAAQCRNSGLTERHRGGFSMQIRAGFEIAYECRQPTPMLLMLSLHPTRMADLVGRAPHRLHPADRSEGISRRVRQRLHPHPRAGRAN